MTVSWRTGMAAGLLCVASLATVPAVAAPTAPATPTVEFVVKDERITEQSGLASDTQNDVYWMANDSGSSGVVYGVTEQGSVRGTLKYDAQPHDVEALAFEGGRLYVGDIGDNEKKREKVTVYRIDSPTFGSQPHTAYDFVYPDGAHDAEAMAVDKKGRLYIITKEDHGGIYVSPRQLQTGTANRLERVADAPAYVTDATFLTDGRLAVRTYLSVEILTADVFGQDARAQLPFQRQGETITQSLNAKYLLVGSEGANMPVMRVPIPQGMGPAPTGVSTPPPTPVPSASATPTAQPEPSPAVNRGGTLVALGLALVVSITAGVVVYLRRS